MKKLLVLFCCSLSLSASAQQVAIWGTEFGTNLATSATTSPSTYRQRIPVAVDTNGYLKVNIATGGSTAIGNVGITNEPQSYIGVTNVNTNSLFTRAVSKVSTNIIGVYNGGAAGTTATTSGNVYTTFTNAVFDRAGGSGWLSYIQFHGSTNCPVDIYLFNYPCPAVTGAVQGSAWTYSVLADSQYRCGPVISLTSFTSMGTSWGSASGNLNIPLKNLDSSSNIYGVIISRGAVTNHTAAQIASSTNYFIGLGLLLD